jgi:hypothetical protein
MKKQGNDEMPTRISGNSLSLFHTPAWKQWWWQQQLVVVIFNTCRDEIQMFLYIMISEKCTAYEHTQLQLHHECVLDCRKTQVFISGLDKDEWLVGCYIENSISFLMKTLLFLAYS